jgi:hypothetical protein
MSINTNLPDRLPPDLVMLLKYWQKLSSQIGQTPKLSDIDLMNLYQIAPRVFIADRIVENHDGVRYRWRYWGTACSLFVGSDLTGNYLDQTHDEKATQAALECYEWSINTGNPQHFRERVRVLSSHNVAWQYERLIVPLLGHSPETGHIIGVYYSKDEGKVQQAGSLTGKRISYAIE